MSYGDVVFDFRVYPPGMSDKIWRRILISAGAPLSDLGRAALASVQADPDEPFTLTVADRAYAFDRICACCSGEADAQDFAVGDVCSDICDSARLVCGQWTLQLQLCNAFRPQEVIDAELPQITDGAGRGIIESLPPEEVSALISATDATGTAQKVDINCLGRAYLWDYRDFDIQAQNRYMHDKLR